MNHPSQVTPRISQLESNLESLQSSPTLESGNTQQLQLVKLPPSQLTTTRQSQLIKADPKPEPSASMSTHTRRKTRDDRLVDKNQIGLKCLYEPPKDTTTKENRVDADIVAVHGLGADPDKAWIDRETGVNWIKDMNMLPSTLPKARILRYGYESKWFGRDAIKTSLQNLAEAFLLVLKSDPDRQQNPTRPLIFICHCFGGLIVEKALLIARAEKKSYPEIFKACRGIVLMGTPHYGTGKFTAQQILAEVVAENIHVEFITQSYLDSNNDTLVSLVSDFTKLIRNDKVRDRLSIVCFFEQISTQVSLFRKKIGLEGEEASEFVVDKQSASLEGCNCYGLPLNHFGLNTFAGPDDGLYNHMVRPSIVEMVGKIPMLPEKAQKPTGTPTRNTSFRQATSYRPPLSVPPYDRDSNFQGRKEILDTITKKFIHPVKHRVVLYGTPGIGKSHIANEYAHRYSETTPRARVFWLPSRTPGEFERAYIRLGNELHINGMEDPKKDPLELVKAHLSEETQGSWLMILDGADRVDDLDINPQTAFSSGRIRERKMVMDCLPSSPLGSILATTCSRLSARELANKQPGDMLEVKAFTQEEGLLFVRTKLPQEQISDLQVYELLKLIHSVPIALAQALAYLVKCPETNAAEYLISLASLATDEIPKTHSAILATSKLSFKRIENINSPCAYHSMIISMFDFQNIPISLLRHYDDRVDTFRNLLEDFGLINVPTDRAQVGMNPLVRSSLKALQTDKASLSSEILMVLSENFPSPLPGKSSFPSLCAILLPYAESALKLKSSSGAKGLSSRATLLFNTARYNAHLKRYELAIEGLKESIELREKESGKDSESVVEAKTVLENIEQQAKDSTLKSASTRKPVAPKFNDCLEIAHRETNPKQLKEVEERLAKHLQTLKTQDQEASEEGIKVMDGLGILYDTIGQHENAMPKHAQILEWCKTKYGLNGPDDLHTYRQIHKVARNLDLRGDYGEAEKKYLEALHGTERRVGEGHPEVYRILCNLATVYGIQGKTKHANETFERAISVQSGAPNRDSLLVKHNFAVFLQSQKNLDQAEDILKEVLVDQEQILGSNDPDTLRTASNLAKNFWLKGKDETAITMSRVIMPRQIGALGSDHTDSKATKEMIADIESDSRVLKRS